MASGRGPSTEHYFSNTHTRNNRDKVSGLEGPTREQRQCLHDGRVWENRHHGQHKGVGQGSLDHVDNTPREVVGQYKRRNDSFWWGKNQSGSIRQRRRFRFIAGGIVFSNYVLRGPVKCATERLQPPATTTMSKVSLRCPISLQPTTNTVQESLQDSEEKEGN